MIIPEFLPMQDSGEVVGIGRGEAVNQQQTLLRNPNNFQKLNKNPSLLGTNTSGEEGWKQNFKNPNKINFTYYSFSGFKLNHGLYWNEPKIF